jgi:O-antigen ligase
VQSRLTTGGLAIAVLGTVGGLALAQGGYFPRASGATSVLVLWAIAFGLLFVPRVRLSRLGLTMLAGLGALVAWTGLSLLWSLDPAQTMVETERGLAYLAVLAGLQLFLRPASVGAVLAALVAACTLICLQALAVWLLSDAAGRSEALAGPVGYSGALGLLAAMGAMLALGMAARAPTPLRRGLAWAALVPLAITLVLAGSRAAYVAIAIGLVVAVAVSPERRTLLRSGGVPLGLVLVLLVAGSLALVADAGTDSRPGPAAGAFDSVRTERSLEARRELWAVAWGAAQQEPILGAGAGSYERLWVELRRSRSPAREAHNLYLETLAELGVVGAGLLLVVLTVPLMAGLRGRRRRLTPAALGAYVAFLVHAGAHWDWEMPALTLAALVCGAALVAAASGARPAAPVRLRWRTLAVGAVLGASAIAYTGVAGHAALARGEAAAWAGAPDQASEQARVAARWQPWSGEPWRLIGEALLAEGEARRARAAFRRGLERDPANWRLWAELARASHGRLRRLASGRADRLNPGWRDVDGEAATL